MPSHSPRFPPITEIIVHTERPVRTVLETIILNKGVTISRLESAAKIILIHEAQNEIGRIFSIRDFVFKPN